jgi:peptidoglycan/LPS O-acetylase OafA/YrhL
VDTPPPTARLAHQPALDGLRAVAVAMVLLFHGGVSWMHGGYFGVSVFFTLSGFLITSLLVREFDQRQRISPLAFYTRRAKRLLPASTLCLAIVSIMATRDVWRGANHLRRDALGALFQVANWVQLAGGGSYTDLQSKKVGLLSPLDHYWSLAIEEQFYWLWPLCFWGLARLARRRGWSLTRILGGLTAFFAALAPLIAAVWGRDAAYWATPARAAEILIGALVAVALMERRIAPRRWMAPFFLVAVVVIGVVLPAAGGPAYHGAFPLLAVASAGLLLGLQRPGPVRRMLSWRPFVALGAISYGVYLFHFPVYVFISPSRAGRSGWSLLALRLLVTLSIAIASYWIVERPIRRASWNGARTLVHAAVAVALVLVAVVFVPVRNATYWTTSAAAIAAAEIPKDGTVEQLVVAPATTVPHAVAPSPTTTIEQSSVATVGTEPDAPLPATPTTLPAIPVIPTLNRPVRIIVVGDSTAQATGGGLVQWAALHPDLAKVSLFAAPGCGFVRGGVVPTDGAEPFTAHCDHALDHDLPIALRTLHPDVVMLMTTIRDIEPRIFDDAEGPVTPRDESYVARARVSYDAITKLVLDSSPTVHIAWIRPPAINQYWLDLVTPSRDPGAHEAIERLMREEAGEHPDRVTVLDLRSWLEEAGLAENHDYRPDGVHLGQLGALDVAQRWLGPELIIEATRSSGG